MNQIRFQYDDLEVIARLFRQHSDRADDVLRRMLTCLRLMDDGAWIGKGSEEFREELEDIVIPAVRRLSAVLADTAWTLDRGADIMREADDLAAAQFRGEGRPLNVNFGGIGIAGRTFGGFGSWTAGEIARLGDIFGGRRDDLAAANATSDEDLLGRRYGNNFFNRAQRYIREDMGGGNPDVPPGLPGDNGPVVTPPWFTEHSAEDGGLNGAADASVLVAGAGDHNRLLGDIAKTSKALGGAQVAGVFAAAEDGVVRGPGAIPAGAPIAPTLSPAAQSMMEWIRAHPNGLFILPPFAVGNGTDALNALAAEGFDLSSLNVVVIGQTEAPFPEGPNVRVIAGLPDLKR